MAGFHFPLLLHILCLTLLEVFAKQPNIVIIIADDLGWDDVGFHGSPEAKTPHLDKLASEGVILMDYYVQPICTPTRSALMTGKYPIHNGMQSSVIMTHQAWGLGLEEKLLPQYLQEVGYKTHLVGKWHLGFFAKEYTPLQRGFDSFYGCYAGRGDYWDHESESGEFDGLDLWDGEEPVTSQKGNYSTYMFSDVAVDVINNHDQSQPLFLMLSYQAVHSANTEEPLQAPTQETAKFANIKHDGRKVYMAMTSAMDTGIGKVYKSLKDTGMLDNTIILFTTDNGGAPDNFDSNQGSNFPLRGIKTSLFEGGVRAVGFVHSDLLEHRQKVSKHLIHVTDWFPTILSLAGGNPNDVTHDGYNIWNTVSKGAPPARKEILLNIDDYVYDNAAIREKRWKYVMQQPSEWSGWFNSPDYDRGQYKDVARNRKYLKTSITCGRNAPDPPDCSEGCLFDMQKDPCEYVNLSNEEPIIFKRLKDKLDKYKSTMVKPRYNDTEDPKSDPRLHEGRWEPWVVLSNSDLSAETATGQLQGEYEHPGVNQQSQSDTSNGQMQYQQSDYQQTQYQQMQPQGQTQPQGPSWGNGYQSSPSASAPGPAPMPSYFAQPAGRSTQASGDHEPAGRSAQASGDHVTSTSDESGSGMMDYSGEYFSK